MLKSQNLINKICARIACGGLTSLEDYQTTLSLNLLNSPVSSVATFANLPLASDYEGRMVYVDNENRYYHAVDGFWLNNFGSQPFNYEDLLFSWGDNFHGQLGDNTTTRRSSPVSVTGGFFDWCNVSAGEFIASSLAIRSNGTAWAWGFNYCGGLGNNSTISASSPVSVVGGISNWCRISAGRHSLALQTNGTAWGWGTNSNGTIGNNTNQDRSSPVSVVGGFTDWCKISAGLIHSLAVRTGGTAWAWGFNGYGVLGDNSSVSNRSSPVSVVGGFSDWCDASAGSYHSLAVRTGGSAWAWGCSGNGRLGNNTTTGNRSSPVSVVGDFTDWCQVSAGGTHSLAIRTTGSVWSWGSNNYGQLGDGNTTDRSSPVSVAGGFSDWCQVEAGHYHSLAVRTGGTVWSWGRNNFGQLGDNTSVGKSSPVNVVGGRADWCQISAGCRHSVAIRQVCKGF